METNSMINFLNIREHFPQYHEDKSHWAYGYCKNIKDKKEAYKLITDSNYAYFYCEYIKDRKAVRKFITDSYWAYTYCRTVKDRPSIRKYITDSHWASCYRGWKQTQ